MGSMQMSDSSSSNSTMAMTIMMVPYLHFTGGDFLFFKSWNASSHGAIAGACIGLVALAILERWIHGVRGILEDVWRRRTLVLMSREDPQNREQVDNVRDSASTSTKESEGPEVIAEVVSLATNAKGPRPTLLNHRSLPPFIPSHDLPRGAIFAMQSLLAYTLMLAVMTFQAAYLISVLVGLGIGEMFFGRLGYASLH